jgi:hypothetical protein
MPICTVGAMDVASIFTRSEQVSMLQLSTDSIVIITSTDLNLLVQLFDSTAKFIRFSCSKTEPSAYFLAEGSALGSLFG